MPAPQARDGAPASSCHANLLNPSSELFLLPAAAPWFSSCPQLPRTPAFCTLGLWRALRVSKQVVKTRRRATLLGHWVRGRRGWRLWDDPGNRSSGHPEQTRAVRRLPGSRRNRAVFLAHASFAEEGVALGIWCAPDLVGAARCQGCGCQIHFRGTSHPRCCLSCCALTVSGDWWLQWARVHAGMRLQVLGGNCAASWNKRTCNAARGLVHRPQSLGHLCLYAAVVLGCCVTSPVGPSCHPT